MYNNSRLAFFRSLNDNVNKVEIQNATNLDDNSCSSDMLSNFSGTLISSLNTNTNNNIIHKQLLDSYNIALKNVQESKQLLDNFLANVPQTYIKTDENQTLSQITEQASYQYIYTQNNNINQLKNEPIEIITPQLLYCDWDKIKSDPTDIENIVSLINVNELIYPYLERLINLKTISFSDNFNATINLSDLNNLEDITFGSNFNQIVSKDNLPTNLKKLKLGLNFLRKIDDLPNNIEEITLDNRFNSTLILPANLISLTVGDSFNQEIELNNMLESITFGYHFNKHLILSKSLKKLSLPGKFNQDLELNDCLEELSLGQMFNKNLKLPNSMKILTLKNRSVLSKITLNKNVKINM